MDKKQLLKLFIKLLKENNAYEIYLNKLHYYKKGVDGASIFIVKTMKYFPDELIVSAFPWVSEPTQKKTWSRLHEDWCNILKNNL